MNKKMRIVTWFLIIIGLAMLLSVQLQRDRLFTSNILDLLPNTENDPIVQDAIDVFSIKVGHKYSFLIGSKVHDEAKKAARIFYESLNKSKIFERLIFHVDESKQNKMFTRYFPFRYHLLSTEQLESLRLKKNEQIINQALQKIYSPFGGSNSALLKKDPLLLFPSFMADIPRISGNLKLVDQLLTVKDNGTYYIFLAGFSSLNAFVKQDQELYFEAFDVASKASITEYPNIKILSAGIVKHAYAGRRQAEKEISTIGFGSILGIIFLVGMIFRSVTPLILSCVAIGCGILSAVAISLLVFKQLHVLTLVFGASLIGVSIDYSFHYFSDRLMSDHTWTPNKCLTRIMPGISLGLATSILGYLGLLVAPFPGLQQMAIFSSVGLVAAFLTVICWFPWLSEKPTNTVSPWLVKPILTYLNFWNGFNWTNKNRIFLVFCFIAIGWGIFSLKPNDDIRLLQQSNPNIIAEDQAIQKLTQQGRASQFFLVEGHNLQQLLENEEQLIQQLDALVNNHTITGYQAISSTLPSDSIQAESYQLIKKQLFDNRKINQYMEQLGFSELAISTVVDEFYTSNHQYLTFADWQQTPIAEGLSHLWLGETPRGVASIVLLSGVKNTNLLKNRYINNEQITLIDVAGDVSNVFKRYRKIIAIMVFISYLLIFFLLCWRYGYKRAWVVIFPPVIAALTCLAWFGLSGQLFNLFNVLALLIVLAIGIDYTLFLEEGKNHQQSTMLAILLSALTTLLSFGLLALSETPVISSFGQTMVVGIIVAFLLSPFVFSIKNNLSVRTKKV